MAFSTGCKITTSAETGERVTKEAASSKWKEKYVKNFSENITADGVVILDGGTEMPSYDQLKDAMMTGSAVEAAYNVREENSREGKTAGGYKGQYIITSLDLDGQAGDDAKLSISLENTGKVEKQSDGLTNVTA